MNATNNANNNTSYAEVYKEHQTILASAAFSFRRFYIDTIDWEERLNFILGARGSGKTSIILQRILETFGTDDKALYISMDDLVIAQYNLLEIADYHIQRGGTHLFIDEIHKYANWSQELKNINDKYKQLKVVVSGSNILDIQKGKSDLSRRAVEWEVPGLSLREYINIETGQNIAALTLADLLKNHVAIAHEITKLVKPGAFFQPYLEHGYYPFYLEGKKGYHKKLNNVLNVTLEVDMPQLLGVDVSKIPILKKLIYILTTQTPFTPNITQLGASLGVDRGTLYRYLNYLEKCSITKMLWDKGKSYSLMSKPDKLYLHNTNLFYLTQSQVDKGSLRESFLVSQLSYQHELKLPPAGDFLVDDNYILEVGGKNKGYKQIANMVNSYIAADDLLVGSGNRIPLWMFGYLY